MRGKRRLQGNPWVKMRRDDGNLTPEGREGPAAGTYNEAFSMYQAR